MQLHCRYHPTRVPVLICSQCSNTVCPDCVPFWPERGMPRCITCRAEMEPLGISEYVKPFWQCFDQFFKFPLKSESLVFIISTLFLFMFVPLDTKDETTMGFFFRMITWIAFPSFIVAYLSAVAIKASDGNQQPPSISKVWSDGGFSIFFKAMLIVFIYTIAKALAAATLGEVGEFLLTLLATLAFPASLILLFLERDIGSAISPARIIGVMRAVGWPYMFLWGLVMMLTSGPDIVMSLPDSFLHSIIFPSLVLLANLYFGIVLFHLLGYVVFQYHYELGVALPSEQIDALMVARSPQKAIILEAEILIMEGKYHSAIALLQRFIKDTPHHDPKQDQVWLKLYEIAVEVCEYLESVGITEDYIEFLISRQQSFKVVALLRNLMHKKPQLKLTDFSTSTVVGKFLEDEKELDLLQQLS